MARKTDTETVDGADLQPDYSPPANPAERRAIEIAGQLQRAGELDPEEPIEDALNIPADLIDRAQLYIRVHRVSSDGKRVYLGRHDPRNFDLETIRGEYGGGNYWVCMVGPNPRNNGRNSIFWQAYPSIAGEPKISAPALATPAVDQNNNALMLEGFKALALGMQQGFQMIAERMGKQPTLRDQLADMVALQQLFPKTPDTMGLVRDVLGLVREITPQPAPDSDSPFAMLMQSADKILPMVQAAMELQKQQPAPANPTPAIAPAPISAAKPAPQTQEQQEMNIKQMQFKMGLAFLCDRAVAGSPADLQADNVLDHLPDDEINMLVERSDWFALLCSVEPRCAEHEAWFSELRDAIIERLSEDANEKAD